MAGGERDAHLHLMRVVAAAVQTAVARHGFGCLFDNRQLKPRPRNTRLTVTLAFNKACRVLRPERLPLLVTCYFRQRTIAAQRRSVPTLQPTKQKSLRRQWGWKNLAHSVVIRPCLT